MTIDNFNTAVSTLHRAHATTRRHRQLRMFGVPLLALAACLALSCCGNVSRDVAKDGSGAGRLVWPSPDSVTPMHKGGTFPLVGNVQALHAGMNKPQIAQLIGYPHFEEGVWGVREWNYVFNFRDAGSDQVTVCEFKVLFDQDKLARSFYWKPEDCARYMTPPPPAPAAEANTAPKETTFSADALFAFDRSSIGDITDGGRAQLDHLAQQLLGDREQIKHIQVLGYTDRLGGDAYNDGLSQRRADAVMHYLAQRGVPADLMEAQGRGKSDPVVQCDDKKRSALIACLAPNRRVVVQVVAREH